MEVKKITIEQFDEAKAKKPKKGKYAAVIAEVIATGDSAVVSGLTRGQVSAFYRTVKGKDVDAVFSYAEGRVYLAKKIEK